MPLCPVCHVPMASVEENEVCAVACPSCHGQWINTLALKRRTALESDPKHPHTDLPSIPELAETVSLTDSKAPLSCPTCLQEMVKEHFSDKIPVNIDRCNTCDHVWLDAGELALLITLYRQLIADSPTANINPDQQQKLDRLQDLHSQSVSYTSSRSGPDGAEIAVNVGLAVLNILVDIFLAPSYRRRW